MPIITGTLALSSAAQQLTATKTQVVGLFLTSTTTCYIGGSGVKADGTGGGVSIPTNGTSIQPAAIFGPQGTFNLIELYAIGTSGTLSWLGVTR